MIETPAQIAESAVLEGPAPEQLRTISRKGARKTARSGFCCSECGNISVKWLGRCPQCQAWGSLVETAEVATDLPLVPASLVQPISEVASAPAQMWQCGVSEFDRVLGGGVVHGSVILLTGDPGVGKSTLLLEIAAQAAADGKKILYVSAEESAAQVHARAHRIDALHPNVLLAAESQLDVILWHIQQCQPDLLIVDSVQTVCDSQTEGSAGGVSQVREVASTLIRIAKSHGMATILVGHVTKDGSIAGPRTLEHLVDVCCHFEGDRHNQLRVLRAIKNRYGSCDEVGCFELRDTGIHGLTDPSGLFVTRHQPLPGTAVTVTLEGRRPLAAEVQALVGPTGAPAPRRTTSGLDSSRVAMIAAVLERRVGIRLAGSDVYTATVAGVRVSEPAADVAIALAIATSARNIAAPADLVVIGEVGLAGDIRPTRAVGPRLAEAARIGCRRAIISGATDEKLWQPYREQLDICCANDIHTALNDALKESASSATADV